MKVEIVQKYEEYVECINNAKSRNIFNLDEDKNIDLTTFHQKALTLVQADREDKLTSIANETIFEGKEIVEDIKLDFGGDGTNINFSEDSSLDAVEGLLYPNLFSKNRKDRIVQAYLKTMYSKTR